MRLSAELSPNCPPEEIANHAWAIEAYGFARIWVRDMISVPWESWVAATSVALATKNIRIGLDVTNVYTRSVAVTAHAAATLDRISGGRLDLGFGRGIAPHLAMLGIRPHKGALEEGIKRVRQLLMGKAVQMDKAPLKLALTPRQESVPIYIAALEEGDFRTAAKLADGVLTISANERFLLKAMGWLKESLGRRPLIPVATWIPFSASEEALINDARRILKFRPPRTLKVMGLDTKGTKAGELKESFAIHGVYDLAQKIERLEAIGISEIILEYLALSDLSLVSLP